MELLKISAVSYLNTFPFVYGIERSGLLADYRLELDIPSLCAEKLRKGTVDVALIPVGALSDFASYDFVTDFCIGAVNSVKTVLLLSHKPIEKIREIGLDYDSRTSVRLIKVLARHSWKIDPSWKNLMPGQAATDHGMEAIVAIGDKTFELIKKYPYCYDLAEEWIKFTSLPFVFAAWVTTKTPPPPLLQELNRALNFGVSHISETLEFFKNRLPVGEDCKSYLEKNISYTFDEPKKKGLGLFLDYIKEQR
ncbi:MAG: menaquinone biosynthesis protein [Bacteroidetes bacterium]|nr:menaquinone biosynthesis protein [Bacteroidota bacterium]